MTMIPSQGTAQIVFYVLVLLALTPLLGSYMARVYEGEHGAPGPLVRLRRARLLPAAAHVARTRSRTGSTTARA